MLPLCEDCQKKFMAAHDINSLGPIISNSGLTGDFVSDMKKVYKDPEFQKSIRQTFGVKTDQDMFDEDDEQ